MSTLDMSNNVSFALCECHIRVMVLLMLLMYDVCYAFLSD